MSIFEDLKRDEGLRLKPYRCTAGKLTIGYGRNLEDRGITIEEAEYLLSNDIEIVCKNLSMRLSFFDDLDPVRKSALINMCFNLGLSGLMGFKKMLRAIEQSDYEQAAVEALNSRWANQVGDRAVRIADKIKNGV